MMEIKKNKELGRKDRRYNFLSKSGKYYYSIITLELRIKWVELAFLFTPRFMQKRINRLWEQIKEYRDAIEYLNGA